MSQSSLEDQIKEAQLPVKRGFKVIESKPDATLKQQGSDIWLLRWARNSYLNYPRAIKQAQLKLDNSCKGLPAIVVGVGPSLDDSIEDLKQAKGHAIIIATDAAFRTLMAHGIKPDLVLSFDCKQEQGLLWESVPAHDVPLLIDVCAHPEAIDSWKGPFAFYRHFHQTDQFSQHILPHVFGNLGQIPSGGTVGNSALLLSKALGCSVAITVGMDFCFKEVGGSWRYRAQDYRHADDAWVPTELKLLYDNDERFKRSFLKLIKGEEFRVDKELEWYLETCVGFINYFKLDLINCSENGALSKYCKTMPLADALNEYCKATVFSPIGVVINE